MASTETKPVASEAHTLLSPGELVLKKIFAEFVALSNQKLRFITSQALDFPLGKALQRGEDSHFDQLLNALNEVASFSLRSVLVSVFSWKELQFQNNSNPSTTWPTIISCSVSEGPPASPATRKQQLERQELAIEFLFCLVLIEVLTKLPVHPVPEDFIHKIEESAFYYFKQPNKEKDTVNPNAQNIKKIADLYAEVVGVLSQSRFHSICRRFFQEIKDPQKSSSLVVRIIEGLSFMRVKMFPVEELELWFHFLQDCATFLLECSREKIKNAMCALLVEILVPVASVIKFESSLPVVRKLISMLYGYIFDQAKKKHATSAPYISLLTVLLAISEGEFFLQSWYPFLSQVIIPIIKRGDSKLQRPALESLYRLVWVYMIRLKGENNVTTQNRLRMIVDTLFPRAGRLQPKDMPLNIFVKIIHYIAKYRLDYAMQEIINELAIHRDPRHPERTIVFIRAFLVIADSLEKKESDIPMPSTVTIPPSGGSTRVKTKFLSTSLSEDIARNIGVENYYPEVRKALGDILRSVDQGVGRTLLQTNLQAVGRNVEEVLTADRLPKLDLLKTCVAAIPRIIPSDISNESLVDLLSHLTIHIDHELCRAAGNTLQNIITNFPTWRDDVVGGMASFILRGIPDSCPLVLENALKILTQFVTAWRHLATEKQDLVPSGGQVLHPSLHLVEGCALVFLCNYRAQTKRISLTLLKETRLLMEVLKGSNKDTPVMDVLEKVTSSIVKSYVSTLTPKEKSEHKLLSTKDPLSNLCWMADRSAVFLEQGGSRNSLRDAWAQCIAGLLEPHLLPAQCPTAVTIAWPYVVDRMKKVYSKLDPAFIATDKGDKPPSMKGRRPFAVSSPEMFLWRNYVMFACCAAPNPSNQLNMSGSAEAGSLDSAGHKHYACTDCFSAVVPLLRSEGEILEVAITSLGLVHPVAFGALVEELKPLIHEAMDVKKTAQIQKKRRREIFRVQITRVFELTAEHGCFRMNTSARTETTGQISPVFSELIESIKTNLETESDSVNTTLQELRLHLAAFIANVINSIPKGVERMKLFTPELRYSLFYLFSSWCELFGISSSSNGSVEQDSRSGHNGRISPLGISCLEAMSSLICAGPIFHNKGLDPQSSIYTWLENMLICPDTRVQSLGQRTVQMLLMVNSNTPCLINWVVDRCIQTRVSHLCFHALSKTLVEMPTYPCDMVTMLHVVLYKTADTDVATRQRATNLLQILDRRFFSSMDSHGDTHSELFASLVAGTFSKLHVRLSQQLARSNPELTLPMFSEMVYRFTLPNHSAQRNILQYMVPWLKNVELVEDNPSSHSVYKLNGDANCSNSYLKGSGWGSVEGTRLILHNLLFITTKYGEEYWNEVESLWSALCTWPSNIRVTLNYLARLTCVSGTNPNFMLQQVKKIVVCFSKVEPARVVSELIRDLQAVELISSDIQPMDTPPHYQYHRGGVSVVLPSADYVGNSKRGSEGWAVSWRTQFYDRQGQPLSLPIPVSKQFFANFEEICKFKQLFPLHKCNFALTLLSELVLDIQDGWTSHLPLLLHVMILGLDLNKPIVFEHSKRLLGNLLFVLICHNNAQAASQVRMMQQSLSCHSPLPLGYVEGEAGHMMEKAESQESLLSDSVRCAQEQVLSTEAKELVEFASSSGPYRPPWPYSELSGTLSGKVLDLSTLVNKILKVFQSVYHNPLKEHWARIALQWAITCSSHQYASQSFQVCRALELPLSSEILSGIITRLTEVSSEHIDDLRKYVLEIVLTLEAAIDCTPSDVLNPAPPPLTSASADQGSRRSSDLTPLASGCTDSAQQLSQQSAPMVPSQSSGLGPMVPSQSSGLGPMVPSQSSGLGPSTPSSDNSLVPSEHSKKLRHTRGTSITRADVSGTSGPRPSSAKTSVSTTQVKTSASGRESPQRLGQMAGENRSQVERAVSPTNVKLSGSFSRDASNEGTNGGGGSGGGGSGGGGSGGGGGGGEDGYSDVKHQEKSSEHQLSIHQKAAGVESAGGVSLSPGGGPTSPSNAHAAGPESKPPPGKLPKQMNADSCGTHTMQRQVDMQPAVHQKHFSMDTSGFHMKQMGGGDSMAAHPKHAAAGSLDSGVLHQKHMSVDTTGIVHHQKHVSVDATAIAAVHHQKQASADGGSQQMQGVADGEGAVAKQSKQLSMDSASALLAKQNTNDVEYVRQSSADAPTPSVTLASPFHSPKLSRRAPIPILINSGGGFEVEQRSPLVSRQTTLVRAHSTQALDKSQQSENKGVKHRSYTFTGDTKEIVLAVPADDSTLISEGNVDDMLVSSEEDSLLVVTSSPFISIPPTPEGGGGGLETHVAPGSNQMGVWPEHGGSGSATPVRPFSVRTSSAGLKKDVSDGSISSRIRPRSMIETSCGALYHSREMKATPPDALAQLFWTSCSLLESDYEDEFSLALKLFSKVLDKLDLSSNETHDRLQGLQSKMKWHPFNGVLFQLFKGLTHPSASDQTHGLLARILPYSNKPLFDNSQSAGLPLSVLTLLPLLFNHFDQPTDFCKVVVSNIQEACASVSLPSEDAHTKLQHMAKMFQLYANRECKNGPDIWLASICRYINDVYASLAAQILRHLAELLEKGRPEYYRSLLRIMTEHLKLQVPTNASVRGVSQDVMTVVFPHLKGDLWKESIDIMKLIISSSASFVRPPTHHIPADLGLFNQSLPGPTLQFSIDLKNPADLAMGQDHGVSSTSSWKRPQGCQRKTREKLISVLSACTPVALLMTSPSVVFAPEYMADKLPPYSSDEDGNSSTTTTEVPDSSSQHESQAFAAAVGDEFKFLDDMDYMYESGEETETPDRWNSFHNIATEDQEDEQEQEPRLHPSGSFASLDRDDSTTEIEEDEERYPTAKAEPASSRAEGSSPAPQQDELLQKPIMVPTTSMENSANTTPQPSPPRQINRSLDSGAESDFEGDKILHEAKTGISSISQGTVSAPFEITIVSSLSHSGSEVGAPTEQPLLNKPGEEDKVASNGMKQAVSLLDVSDLARLHNSKSATLPRNVSSQEHSKRLSQPLFVPPSLTLSTHPDINEIRESRFLDIPNDEIEEVWQDHVTNLGRHKTCEVAVHTFFIFGRLFAVLRQQFCNLTREACNYLGECEHMRSIVTHFLSTVDMLSSEFELPKIYLDTELLICFNLLDQHVFLVLELQDNLASYQEKRKIVLECLGHFKSALRQKSLEEAPPSPAHGGTSPDLTSISSDEAATKLCEAVRKYHFQLLVLLGSYVKLVDMLKGVVRKTGTDLSAELTEVKQGLEESARKFREAPPEDRATAELILSSSTLDVPLLEATLVQQKDNLKAIQLLHVMRKLWHKEGLLGSGDEDDVDFLFFLYAHNMYVTERQKGVLCVTDTKYDLSTVHSKLMARNVSLISLLQEAEQPPPPL